jgi:PAS domain S-box-containing protein
LSKLVTSTEVLPSSQGERVARVERQLAIAQQITHIGSWDWELATNVVTWSDELYRIYGLEPGTEVTFESFLSRLHAEDRARVEREVAAALQRGGRFAYEERILRPDGTMRTLDTVGEVRTDKAGRTTGLIGTCRDVTDERKRDEQIRRYADIVRNVQIGLCVWKVDDPSDAGTIRLVAFNPAAEHLVGRDLDRVLGKTLGEVRPRGRGGQFEALILSIAREEKVREETFLESRDPKDPTRAVAIKAFPLPGKCVGTAIEDITRQTLTRQLQEAEQRVLESLAEGAPLADVLSSLVRAVEAHSPPAVGAIHLRDTDGEGFPARVSPTLDSSPDGDASLHVYASEPILARDDRDLGDFVLYMSQPARLTDEDTAMLERAANLARIAIERRQLEDQLRDLSAHVENVREDERTGIAREIHDELGQSLTALKMDIAWIGRRSTSDAGLGREALLEKLTGMSKMTDEIIDQVRRISAALRPGVLDDLGLVAAIEWQAAEFEARTGTSCAVRYDEDETQLMLDRDASTQVFRIFQEALTNVTRHAKASHVSVRLGTHGDSFVLEVRDDGLGIALDAANGRKSLGLLGVRERARRLGGSVSVERGVPTGTIVSLKVPLARLAQRSSKPGGETR